MKVPSRPQSPTSSEGEHRDEPRIWQVHCATRPAPSALAWSARAGCPRSNAAERGPGPESAGRWRAPVTIAARVRDHGMEEIGMLVGRTKEEGALEDVLAAARDGLS